MEVAQKTLNEVSNYAELLKCVVKGDERWVYGFDIKTKVHPSGGILDCQD